MTFMLVLIQNSDFNPDDNGDGRDECYVSEDDDGYEEDVSDDSDEDYVPEDEHVSDDRDKDYVPKMELMLIMILIMLLSVEIHSSCEKDKHFVHCNVVDDDSGDIL